MKQQYRFLPVYDAAKEEIMVEGTVKWFDKKKGYGFVMDDRGDEVFVHYTCFSDPGIRTLDEGEQVFFEVVPGEKGPRAKNLTKKVAL